MLHLLFIWLYASCIYSGRVFFCAVAVLGCAQLYKNAAFALPPPGLLAPLFSPAPRSALQLMDAAVQWHGTGTMAYKSKDMRGSDKLPDRHEYRLPFFLCIINNRSFSFYSNCLINRGAETQGEKLHLICLRSQGMQKIWRSVLFLSSPAAVLAGQGQCCSTAELLLSLCFQQVNPEVRFNDTLCKYKQKQFY